MTAGDGVKPVAGQIVRRSILKTLGMLAFLLVMFVLGAVIAWAWWTDTGVPLPSGAVHINLLGGIVGIAAALLAPLIFLAVAALLFIGEQIVIGADRLQVVQGGDAGKVVIQIPYANIANMAVVNDQGVRTLGIDLQKLDDPNTFATGWDFQGSKSSSGWHYVIYDHLQRSVDEIHRMLLDKTRDASENE